MYTQSLFGDLGFLKKNLSSDFLNFFFFEVSNFPKGMTKSRCYGLVSFLMNASKYLVAIFLRLLVRTEYDKLMKIFFFNDKCFCTS